MRPEPALLVAFALLSCAPAPAPSITVQEQRLYLKLAGQPAAQLFWGAAGVLFTKRDDLEIVPEGGLSGASSTERFTLRQAGFSGVYERAPARP
jgi:hypothetical protein